MEQIIRCIANLQTRLGKVIAYEHIIYGSYAVWSNIASSTHIELEEACEHLSKVGGQRITYNFGQFSVRLLHQDDKKLMIHWEWSDTIQESDWYEKGSKAWEEYLTGKDSSPPPVKYGVKCVRCGEYAPDAEQVEGFKCYSCRSTYR